MKLPLGTEVGLDLGHIVLDGDPAAPTPKKWHRFPQFSANVYCNEMAGRIKMSLGTRVGVGPGDTVLDVDPAPHQHHHTTTVLRPFFRDHPGEPVPEENFWTLWCKGRLTEADTLIIRLGATPSGPTSAHLHHPHIFLQARCPSCRPANSVKALHLRV